MVSYEITYQKGVVENITQNFFFFRVDKEHQSCLVDWSLRFLSTQPPFCSLLLICLKLIFEFSFIKKYK